MVAPTPPAAVGAHPIPLSGALGGPRQIEAAQPGGPALWGADGFTFGDLVDLVNPLQHIPVVSWAYRAFTGDQISPGAMALGGAMFGGVAGLAAGVVEAVVQGTTGKDPGAHLLALFQDDGNPGESPPNISVAEATPENGIPTLSQNQLDVLLASFGGPLPATDPNPGPAPNADTSTKLSADETALLLASIAAPAVLTGAQPGTQSNQAPPRNAGAIAAFGGLASTANLHPLFLPLVPIAGAGPNNAPSAADSHPNQAKEPMDPGGNDVPADGAALAAAVGVGGAIRALFGL